MNWAYIAGFCDGEGHIRYSYVALYQKNPEVLHRISAWLATQGIYSKVSTRKARVTNFLVQGQESDLRIGRRTSINKFLRGVLPYLIVKKVVAQDVLRYSLLFPMNQKVCGFLGNERLAAGARNRSNPRDPKTGQYHRA